MRLSCVPNVQQTTIAAAYLMFDFINTNTDTLPPFLSLSQWSHNPKHTHRYPVYLHLYLYLYFSCCWDISPWRALTCNRCAPHCAHNCSTGRGVGEGIGQYPRSTATYCLWTASAVNKTYTFWYTANCGCTIYRPYTAPIPYTNRDHRCAPLINFICQCG